MHTSTSNQAWLQWSIVLGYHWQRNGDSQQQDTYNYKGLICTCCDKGYSLNMMTCLFAADVITQNIVCRQGPSTHPLLWVCLGRTHIFQCLVTQMACVLYTRQREEASEGNFSPFRSFYSLPGVIWQPPDLRIRKQRAGLRAFPKLSKSERRYGSY